MVRRNWKKYREGTLWSRYTMWENNLFLITEQNRGVELQKQLKTSEILVQLGEAQERMLTECKRERGCYAGKKTKKNAQNKYCFSLWWGPGKV